MRAFVLTGFGSAPELTTLAVPEPTAGEVRVRVHAASVNGFDLAVAAGYLKDMMEHRFPVVLGKDFAGIIDAVGPGVTGYAAGDRVFGVVTKPYLGDGSFAEYVTVPVAVGLAKLPDGVDFATGAALGLAGAAALDSFDAAQIAPGQVVLVAGATGGVGNQAVQLARHAGATVVATATTEAEQALVTTLGADATVDHTLAPSDFVAAVQQAHPEGVDVIFHFAGDPTSLLRALRPGGRFVSTLIGSPDQLPTDGATVIAVFANPEATTLDRAARHQLDGATRLPVQTTFSLEQAPDALAAFTSGTLGKLVITTA